MTQDEILEMARQTGVLAGYEGEPSLFVIFAKALMHVEREACAKVARQISDKYAYGYYGNEVDTADEIEAAIRARGEA